MTWKYRRKYYIWSYTFSLCGHIGQHSSNWIPYLGVMNFTIQVEVFMEIISMLSVLCPPLYKNKSPCHKWGWEGKWWLSIHIFRQHTEFNRPAMLWFWLYIMKTHGKWFFVYFDDLAVLKDFLSQNHLIKGHIWEWEFRNTRVGMR